MTDSMAYREFKLSVPIWEISDDEGDSEAMRSLFELLSVTPPEISLSLLYDSFREDAGANVYAGPQGRVGRGDVLIFLSSVDDESFIAIDMFWEATDQMNGIEIAIRLPSERSDEVEQVLQAIRTSAEVASALLQGNLGIKEALVVKNFPRHIPNFNTEAIQHVQVFRGGALIHTSSE